MSLRESRRGSYLFRHHPPYHNDPFDGEVIAQSFEQTCELQTIDELLEELKDVGLRVRSEDEG